MKTLRAVVLAGALRAAVIGVAALGVAAVPATAQEVVTIDGVEATRVVIAPPHSELARIIKQGLRGNYLEANTTSRSFAEAQKLYFFYGERGFEPLWLSEDNDGQVRFSEGAAEIVSVFENAHLSGLRPGDYLTDDIDFGFDTSDPAKLASLETAFSAAVLRYANDAHSGRIAPSAVSSSISLQPDRLDQSELLPELADAANPGRILADLEPQNREYQTLKAELARFYDGTRTEAEKVPDGKLIKLGYRDDRVPLLRERLDLPAVSGDREASALYDETLVGAVKQFQTDVGLWDDGVIGPATIAALNGGNATSKADLIANLERWRWMPRDLGSFHVFVNVPEFRLQVRQADREEFATRVVVGTPTNQTPIFSDEIEHIVVNPYWNVPVSIATNEIGPILASDPDYIPNHNMEVLANGRVVDPYMVDWASANLRSVRIRQRPGGGNALGNIKFLFPNQHSVYLHDTPSKSLFDRTMRAFSHGCVRVQDPMAFANALIRYEPRIDIAMIESMVGGGEKWLNVESHVPVHIAYFTLRVDAQGTIRSFGDIYGHNRKLIELLGE